MSEIVRLDELVAATPVPGRPALVAVDGVDGSGKTTFAGRLTERYAVHGRTAHVVHLDDFLNPRAVRHRLGRDSPEGFFLDTYDLAAFGTCVLEPLRCGGPARIVPRSFDHRADEHVTVGPTTVAAHDVVVVEGMFLHRDELAGAWDVSVFLEVPFAISVARMARRDGTSADPEDPSVRRYVEGQRLYLDRCDPRARASYVTSNE